MGNAPGLRADRERAVSRRPRVHARDPWWMRWVIGPAMTAGAFWLTLYCLLTPA